MGQKLVIQSTVDSTNNPSLVVIGPITLPSNVVISLGGKKVIAKSVILDGVQVTERIAREAYSIDFEFDLYEVRPDNSLNSDKTITIFPQDLLDDIFQQIWLPNTVQNVNNTYLNKLGIQQIIIEEIMPETIRASKKINVRMKCYENIPGQTLILTS